MAASKFGLPTPCLVLHFMGLYLGLKPTLLQILYYTSAQTTGAIIN